MSHVQLALNVADLDEAIVFYSKLLPATVFDAQEVVT
jgi:predicted enzyme related to lactoylglutathione lyase